MKKLIPASRTSLQKDARASVEIRNKLASSHDIEEFVREIAAEWRTVQQSFLVIGQYLVTAKLNLPHGEYIRMINDRLPFGRNVAHQLASIYLAVENQDVPLDILPSSYTTAYRIVRMPPELRQKGIASGIITPRATFKQINAFVVLEKTKPLPAEIDLPESDMLRAERDRLEQELARIVERERTIRDRLEEIRTFLGET